MIHQLHLSEGLIPPPSDTGSFGKSSAQMSQHQGSQKLSSAQYSSQTAREK
uniref:Uncharacterized protein n=1 Tax=Arundo donax TaxID=35708 RepID=A0A0A9G8Z4_ARUDO